MIPSLPSHPAQAFAELLGLGKGKAGEGIPCQHTSCGPIGWACVGNGGRLGSLGSTVSPSLIGTSSTPTLAQASYCPPADCY